MALCDLCRTIPFSGLPPPPSTSHGVSYSDNNSELIRTWNADDQAAGFPWHKNLDSLVEPASSLCPLCSLVRVAAHNWIAHYDANQETDKLQKDTSTYDEAPRDAELWLAKRFNGAMGFIVLGRHLSSKSHSTNFFASIGFTVVTENTNPRDLNYAVDEDSGSTGSLDLSAKWLAECVDEHPECDNRSSALPTRVLDVGFSGDMIKLLKTKTNTHSRGLYAALSYCWGHPLLNLTTTLASYEARLAAIRLSEVPKTFGDAVTITRHLQIRYLWIDSLCIIQDDPDDWARESSRMRDVYSGAHIVIAADHARDCSEGCFHVRDPLPNSIVEIPEIGTIRAQVLCRYDELSSNTYMFATEPLSRRTWAMQERVLARRVLHYSTKQMYLECNQGLISETGCRRTGRFGALNKLHLAGSSVEDALRSWELLVTDVCTRKLTNPMDRLPSMAGFASLLGPRIGGEYVAGLWSNALVDGLNWTSWPAPKLDRSGPSWSWAGHGGAAVYFAGNTKPVVKIDTWGVELKNKHNPYGEVREAWIRLRGPVVRLQCVDRPDGPSVQTSYSTAEEVIRFDDIELMRSGQWRELDMHLLGLTEKDVAKEDDGVSALGLVLVSLGDDGQSTKMRRVGWMDLYDGLESMFLTDEICYKTITLV